MSIALVSLDCRTGAARRYLCVRGKKPEMTTRAQFENWDRCCPEPSVWERVWNDLQTFRRGVTPFPFFPGAA